MIQIVSRMKRNPFRKEDYGCSFICFVFIFSAIQVLYGFLFLKATYLTDYRLILISNAQARGIKYDSTSDTILSDEPVFAQKSNFINTYCLWIAPIFFYFFSICWVLSYSKLLFTDITSGNYKEPGKTYENVELCRYC